MSVEVKQIDLFEMPEEYYLAHCVSADFALGAGIAKVFRDKFKMRDKLRLDYPLKNGDETAYIGNALLIDRVFNLVTKHRYYEKPTYATLYAALANMADKCVQLGVTKLAMPKIGCGLDRLDWDMVLDDINTVFMNTDISVVVCYI